MKNRTLVIGIAIVALVLASLSCSLLNDFYGRPSDSEAGEAPRTQVVLPHPVLPTEGELHAESGTLVPSPMSPAATTPPLSTTLPPLSTRPVSSTPPAATPKKGVVEEFFRVWSFGAAYNQVSAPTAFKINQAWQVTEIVTYHWNNGRGKTPGTIGLQASDGTLYGPWQASAMAGSGVPTAAWVVTPNVVIPPGNYTVIDSDPSTWAQNTETRGAGMAWGKGIRQSNP